MGRKFTKEEFMTKAYENNEHVRNGDIEIIGDYNGMNCHIEYLCHRCNTMQNPVAVSIINGCGCKNCGSIQSHKTQSKSNKAFQDELQKKRDNGQDVYSDDEYINNHTNMLFYCSKGHEWFAMPASISRGSRCPYCSNRKVLIGYNDIATTSREDILPFLLNPEDGHKYTRWSNVRIDFKCPLCGHVQNRKIASVAHRGFKCECCGDGISYPNRFGRAVFDQLLPLSYKTEYSSPWSGSYFYDIYFKLNNKEYLVEWDGVQHFEENSLFHLSLAEQQKIDHIKTELAEKNNVHLIRIDCAKSDMDYIKNNILSSDLSLLFDLSSVDWMRCEEQAQTSLVKAVCDAWMSGIHSFTELEKKFHLGNYAVREYINKGVRIGWCDYNSDQWRIKLCHPIRVISLSDNKEYMFESIKSCSENFVDIGGWKISGTTINKYAKNKKPYKGFIFEYMCHIIQN